MCWQQDDGSLRGSNCRGSGRDWTWAGRLQAAARGVWAEPIVQLEQPEKHNVGNPEAMGIQERQLPPHGQ